MSLLERLEEIRKLQGLDPMPDPTRIMEDGQVIEPPPYQVPDDLPKEWIEDEEEPSPLIPRVSPEAPALQTRPLPSLVVMDRIAGYKGRDVELNESEHAQVIRIVLGAVARTVNEQLAEVGVKRVRRRAVKAAEPAILAQSEVPKKRGRPKKEKT